MERQAVTWNRADDGGPDGPDGPDFDEEAGLPDDSAQVSCPYCGAVVEVILDPGGGPVQAYVEDCEVCCRPWQLTVRWGAGGEVRVDARTDDA
jgi:hypothetical protein